MLIDNEAIRRIARTLIAAALAVGASGCAAPLAHMQVPVPRTTRLPMYDSTREIRVATLARPGARVPLVLYATGDGGWHALDREIFDRLVSWGYPVAGFESGAYLKTLGFSGETTPVRLARDFSRIVAFARDKLGVAEDAPVVLVGLSRGSGLDVVAASDPALQRQLGGVVAVALTKEEEHVKHYRRKMGPLPPGAPTRELVMIDTYNQLRRLGAMPIAVIQSTHDHYLSAADARGRFGPDTATRRLVAVEARSHSFGGAHGVLLDRMHASLSWICHRLQAPFTEPEAPESAGAKHQP